MRPLTVRHGAVLLAGLVGLAGGMAVAMLTLESDGDAGEHLLIALAAIVLLLLALLTTVLSNSVIRLRREVRRRREAEARLLRSLREVEHLAHTDRLTGLFNRLHFEELARAELARIARYGGAAALLFIDIDNFKAYNDRHGHAAGDQALRAVAARLVASVRSTDAVCRWGGEEFLVLAIEIAAEDAGRLAEKLRAAIRALPSDGADPVTASIGVATVHDGEPMESLVSRADAALYAAKRDGRDCVRLAT